MNFLSLDEVLAIYDRMLNVGGCRSGVHDFTLLHSAVERPKAQFGGVFLYSTIWLMAASQLHSLVKNHPFEDGNKRTAFFSTLRLLRKNGYEFSAPNNEIIDFVVEVDTKNRKLDEIAHWLKKHAKSF